VADVIPVTPLGLLVGAAASGTWILVGVGRHDHVLTIAAEVAAALVILSVLLVSGGTIALALIVRKARTEEPVALEAEVATMTTLKGLPLRLVPLLRVSWHWEEPEGFEVTPVPAGGSLREQVRATRRGIHGRVIRRFVVDDSLGLARLAFRAREDITVRVDPSVGRMRRAAVVSTLAGGDELPHPWGTVEGDRLELRRHSPGDPARLIVWKVYGRTRKLVIRQPERAVARARSLLAYLVTSPHDEAAAGAARLTVEAGALGTRWTLGADGQSRDAHHEAEALELIAASGVSSPPLSDAMGLAPFIDRNERQGAMRILVFAPARDGAWVDRVAGISARRRGLVDVVLAGDHIGRPVPSRWLSLLLRRGEGPAGVPSEEVNAIARRLVGVGARVAILDRATGRLDTPPSLWRPAMVA